jgi:selenoprotein W-related protein
MDAFGEQFAALKLIPSDNGRFEVSLDGELIYSKLETGDFPENKQILAQIRAKM